MQAGSWVAIAQPGRAGEGGGGRGRRLFKEVLKGNRWHGRFLEYDIRAGIFPGVEVGARWFIPRAR